MKKLGVLTAGIFKENPVFVLMLGLCPTLGVTSSAINGFSMGLAVIAVLACSNGLISLFKKFIPDEVRIPAFIMIIATLVTVVDMVMNAYTPDLYKVLGIFIPLIVVNCIVLGRAESFASKNGVIDSILDGIGSGIGFTLSLTFLGSIREIEIAGSQQKTGGTATPTPNTTNVGTVETKPQQEEKIISVDVNDENVNDYLTIIKANLRTSAKKVDDNIKNQYTVPIGETLVFPVDNEKAIKLSTSPKNANPKISLTNGKVTFRTVYQGQYVLSTYVNGSVNRKITVSAISKYDFNEKDLYKLILQDSEKRDKDVENAVTLYKMLYPAGRYSKEVNYLFLKYAYDIRNNSLINEALAGVKNDFSSYSDSEKATILRAAKLANKSIFIPSEVYNTNNSDLKNALNEYNNSSKAPVDRAPSTPVDNRTVTTEKNKTSL